MKNSILDKAHQSVAGVNKSGVIAEGAESFFAAVAGTLSEDFPTEITNDDLGVDVPRHEWG